MTILQSSARFGDQSSGFPRVSYLSIAGLVISRSSPRTSVVHFAGTCLAYPWSQCSEKPIQSCHCPISTPKTLFLTVYGGKIQTMMIQNIGDEVNRTSFTSQLMVDWSSYLTTPPSVELPVKPANQGKDPVRIVHYLRLALSSRTRTSVCFSFYPYIFPPQEVHTRRQCST